MKVYQSEELLTITLAEKWTFTANLEQYLDGDTLSSVTGVTQTVNTGLLLGIPAINSSGAIEVEGTTVPQSMGVQFSVDARPRSGWPDGATTGSAKVRLVCVTSSGNVISLDCRLSVVA